MEPVKAKKAKRNQNQKHKLRGIYVPAFTVAALSEWGDFFANLALGAIDVLPNDGYMSSCQAVFPVAKLSYDAAIVHYNVGSSEYAFMMDDFDTFLGYFHSAAIYCFLALDEQLSSSTYNDLVKGNNLLLNVLFNGGEQYNDVMAFLACGNKTIWDANANAVCAAT